MALDSVSSFFRKKFGLTTNTRITSSGIKIWMPVFIQEVNRNTELLEMKARRLEAAAERIRERNRKEKEKEEEGTKKTTESSIRRYYSAFLEYF